MGEVLREVRVRGRDREARQTATSGAQHLLRELGRRERARRQSDDGKSRTRAADPAANFAR